MPRQLSPAEFQRSFTIPVAATAVQFLLYGMYAVLFLICIRILVTRKTQRYQIHLATMTSLFILTTIGLILNIAVIYLTVRQDLVDGEQDRFVPASRQTRLVFDLGIAACYVFLLASIISDIILLWRFYLVWGRRMKLLSFPVLMCIGNNALGIASASSSLVNQSYVALPFAGVLYSAPVPFTFFVIVNVTTSSALTLLIAGRILLIKHRTKAFLGRNVQAMYRTAIAATVESGMFYPLALLLFAFSRSPGIIQVMYYSLTLILGIAPTLIIVRTGLGTCVGDE